MSAPGIVREPRRGDFPTAAQYRRALAAWLAGWRYQQNIFRELRRRRRACGHCEP